jgi:hypothetical protein
MPQPTRSCWYAFRERAGAYVDTLNAHLLHQAVEEELTTAQRGALDGSAVAAHASRRRLLNGERLQPRVQQLQTVRQADAQGPRSEGVPGWMANPPQGRTRQHERYDQAQGQLAVLHATNAPRTPSERRAPEHIVVSPGDPAAALGWDTDHVFRPWYTVHTLRDVESPCILGSEVWAPASDAAPWPPMLRRSAQLTGRPLQELLVDSGDVTGHD